MAAPSCFHHFFCFRLNICSIDMRIELRGCAQVIWEDWGCAKRSTLPWFWEKKLSVNKRFCWWKQNGRVECIWGQFGGQITRKNSGDLELDQEHTEKSNWVQITASRTFNTNSWPCKVPQLYLLLWIQLQISEEGPEEWPDQMTCKTLILLWVSGGNYHYDNINLQVGLRKVPPLLHHQ